MEMVMVLVLLVVESKENNDDDVDNEQCRLHTLWAISIPT
jgi:hypothetical protein